jgi:hypothetical protein
MEIADTTDFDLSWLEQKLEPESYFTGLLQSRVARRSEFMRKEIERDRELVREVWHERDELWYWRYRIGGGISGADGLVILRDGKVHTVWCNGRIL